jgi:hypothetical protein
MLDYCSVNVISHLMVLVDCNTIRLKLKAGMGLRNILFYADPVKVFLQNLATLFNKKIVRYCMVLVANKDPFISLPSTYISLGKNLGRREGLRNFYLQSNSVHNELSYSKLRLIRNK